MQNILHTGLQVQTQMQKSAAATKPNTHTHTHTELQMQTYAVTLNVAFKKHRVAIVLAVNVYMQAHTHADTHTANWIYGY